MKKTLSKFSLLVIASMILTACGTAPAQPAAPAAPAAAPTAGARRTDRRPCPNQSPRTHSRTY